MDLEGGRKGFWSHRNQDFICPAQAKNTTAEGQLTTAVEAVNSRCRLEDLKIKKKKKKYKKSAMTPKDTMSQLGLTEDGLV